MFKKFSVEWLSQSFHAQDLDREKCFRNAPNDAFSDAPHASSDAVGEGETKAPSSPTSKYDLLAVAFSVVLDSETHLTCFSSCIRQLWLHLGLRER